jgi:hypothetical protein
MTALQKAQREYQSQLRNYNSRKGITEDFYNGENHTKNTKQSIKQVEFQMNQSFDIMQILVKIFGDEVRL